MHAVQRRDFSAMTKANRGDAHGSATATFRAVGFLTMIRVVPLGPSHAHAVPPGSMVRRSLRRSTPCANRFHQCKLVLPGRDRRCGVCGGCLVHHQVGESDPGLVGILATPASISYARESSESRGRPARAGRVVMQPAAGRGVKVLFSNPTFRGTAPRLCGSFRVMYMAYIYWLM